MTRAPLVELVNVAVRPFRTPGTSLYLTGRAKTAGEQAKVQQSQARLLLPGTSWAIHDNEHWLVVGPNGCGKSTLALALRNGAQILGGQVRHRSDCQARDIAYVSLRTSDARLADMARRVQELGTWDRLTHEDLNVDRLIDAKAVEKTKELAALGIADLLGRHVLELSTGQLRKICIAQELLKRPRICIFDEPFDGLDSESRTSLASLLAQPGPTQTVLISHRINEISEVPGITHVLEIGHDNQVSRMGPKEDFLQDAGLLEHLDHTVASHGSASSASAAANFDSDVLRARASELLAAGPGSALHAASPPGPSASGSAPLIEMRDVTVQFGDNVILKDLTWQVKPGEHWSVEGPNGSGKSMMLGLVTGEVAQVFSNQVSLFGEPRSKMSLEKLRSRLGLVSAKMQTQFQRSHQSAFRVICTGYFGIVGGPCPPCSEEQEAHARAWADCLGMTHLLDRRFTSLSQGQQRLALICRALACGPPELLLLDEPFHGLDASVRQRMLTVLEAVSEKCSIVLVTHHADERPAFIKNRLILSPREQPSMERA